MAPGARDTLFFGYGEIEKTITVATYYDSDTDNEIFAIDLLSSDNGTLSEDDSAEVTILDEYIPPSTEPSVDIDADSDNNGSLESTPEEEADEMSNPGMILQLNIDDDNGNGAADRLDTGAFLRPDGQQISDNDLLPLSLYVNPGDQNLLNYTLTLSLTNTNVKLWKGNDNKVAVPATFTIGTDIVPEVIYAEGVAQGQTVVSWKLYDTAGQFVHWDRVLLSVIGQIDASAHRPVTAPFTDQVIPEAKEVSVGIRRNGDDDDGDGTDGQESTMDPEDNDLIKIDLDAAGIAGVPGVELRITRANTNIRIWEATSDGYLSSNEAILQATTTASQVWVDWPELNEGTSVFEYSVWNSIHNTQVAVDAINFKPFDSMVVMIGGNWQTPADPVSSPGQEGIFELAVDEYHNGDLDVYMHAHSDAESDGSGAIYDAIVSAIE